MTFIQLIILTIAISGPTAVFIGFGLVTRCFFRSCRAKNTKFAVISVLAALAFIALLSIIIIVWFIYGVAHTGKDATTDLIVLSSTVTPAWFGVFAAWRFSRYLKTRLDSDLQ